MNTIRVKVVDLITHLKGNRLNHIEEYEKAMAGYRIEMVSVLHWLLNRAEQSKDVNEDGSHAIKVVKPVSYLDAYDEIIAQLSWTTDSSVDLDHSEFKKYIGDEWSWSSSFNTTVSNYGAASAGKAKWSK